MKKKKVEIEIIQNDNGTIFIKFLSDGCIVPVKNTIQNIGLLSALEVELTYNPNKNGHSEILSGNNGN
jgi:hypothetical protein